MIPEAAVEAAVAAYLTEYNYNAEEIVKLVLEAAAPHMLSHEREQTRLAHVDAVVNAESLGKYEAAIAAIQAIRHADWCCLGGGCPGYGLASCSVLKPGETCDGSECTCDLRQTLWAINEHLG